MDPLKAIVYGIVQGLTEFLPISSSAHLRLTPVLFGWKDPGSAFTAVIQLGTTLAVLIYFRDDLRATLGAWFRSLRGGSKTSPEARIGWAVFYGTLPIVFCGILLKDHIETTFRSLYVIAFGLIAMGLVMLAFDRRPGSRGERDVQIRDGLFVGLWQCLALLPGMSRSGSTISGGLALGFDRVSAARFSFLLGIPSITLAAFKEGWDYRKSIAGPLLAPTLIATLVSFVVGYASIAWLLKVVAKRGVTPFVGYRVALGVLLLFLLGTHRLSPTAGVTPKPPASIRKAP